MTHKAVASSAAELWSIDRALKSLVLESQSTTPALAFKTPPPTNFNGRILEKGLDGDHDYRFNEK